MNMRFSFVNKEKRHDNGLPSKVRTSHYYEHDGALRAYANRSSLFAFLSSVGFIAALVFAIYLKHQPPVVIRVDASGIASVAGSKLSGVDTSVTAQQPTELEKLAFIRLFLDRYLAFTSSTVSRNWADALNMMTKNLRTSAYGHIQEDNLVGKIKDEQIRSELELRSLDVSKGEEPLTYTAFGVRHVHHLREGKETIDKVVCRYQIRIVVTERTESNPSGLLIGEFWEEPIEGEARIPAFAVSPLGIGSEHQPTVLK